ncbi:hypothetical protein GCM10009654_22660 [Streptomyces hebeiensis]|uniref:Lipoprotein n=1 Tax=Streptomyces hebeiensis TaxID=229486 RepID=A0ABN1URW4_9ACTN
MPVTDHPSGAGRSPRAEHRSRAGHQRLRLVVATACLVLTVAGCSGLGRTAVGTVTYETEQRNRVTVSNPLVTGCHSIGSPGAHTVANRTLLDMIMYLTPDCTGEQNAYIATMQSDTIAPGSGPWRSYTIVH